MRQVIWSEPAKADLLDAFAFNLARSFDWAARVDLRLVERARSLVRSPHRGRPVPRTDLRRLSVTDIQYVITYRILQDSITIVSVQHSRDIR